MRNYKAVLKGYTRKTVPINRIQTFKQTILNHDPY